MTIDDLLEEWAKWRALKEDRGLGYASSRINRLMGGGFIFDSASESIKIPYGIDLSYVGAVVDRAVMNLSPRRREVIFLEYCKIGTQSQKASSMMPPVVFDTYRRLLRNAVQQLRANADIKYLLKIC